MNNNNYDHADVVDNYHNDSHYDGIFILGSQKRTSIRKVWLAAYEIMFTASDSHKEHRKAMQISTINNNKAYLINSEPILSNTQRIFQ